MEKYSVVFAYAKDKAPFASIQPDHLADNATRVFDRAPELTNSATIYGALDIGYGACDDEDPAYHVIELNGRMPYLIGFDQHHGVAGRLRDLFTDTIRATITVGSQ